MNQMYSPEAILTKAIEFFKTNNDDNALLIIEDFIYNSKKKNWSQSYEQLINLMIELTVRNNKIKLLKEGLNFYRSISQNTNIESFQDILGRTKELVEDKFQKAQKSYQGIVIIYKLEIRNSRFGFRRYTRITLLNFI